jgi:hypothetical protein
MSLVWSFVRTLLGWGESPADRGRVVRRAHTHCPHSGAPVEIELLMHATGRPEAVLRCSARAEAPPRCDAACRALAESVSGVACAVLIVPRGREGTDAPD